MTNEPLISVIIPAYNRAELIGQTIDSALRQTYRNIEVIVVDDGSTDRTAEVVRGYERGVRFVRQENAGPAAARNRGVAEARGEWIALLDSDDLWLPDKLELQAVHLADGKPRLVSGGVEWFDGESGAVKSVYIPPPDMDIHSLLSFELLAPQSLLFPRTLYESVGGCDVSMHGVEDWDFNIRAAARFPVAVVPRVVTRIRNHGDQLSQDKGRMFHECMRVVAKHRNLHPGCAACARSRRVAVRRICNFYYIYLNARAKQAFRDGELVGGIGLAIKALWTEPVALGRLPVRVLRKLGLLRSQTLAVASP